MNTLLNRYYFRLLGHDPKKIHSWTDETIFRTLNQARLIHIPICIYFFIGYYFSFNLFNLNQLVSICTGAFLAYVIYSIDLTIINMTNKKLGSILIRFFIGLLFSVFGALIGDLIYFEKDVHHFLLNKISAEDNNKFNEDVMVLEKNIATLKNQSKQNWQSVINESDGSGGSGKAGVGSILLKKEQIAKDTDLKVTQEENRLNQLKSAHQQRINEHKHQIKYEMGLLDKMNALHHILKHDPISLILYVIFFLVILILDLLVLITKLSQQKTIDDFKTEVREKVQRIKLEEWKTAHQNGSAGAFEIIEHN